MKLSDFVQNYSAWIVRNRIVVILTCLIVTIALGTFTDRLKFDTNYRIWFESDDPYLAQHDKFLREFGNDDSFVVAFEDEQGILRKEPLQAIQRLTDKFWHLRGVMRVDSLSNFQATRATDDGISVKDLFPADEPLDAQAIKAGADYIAGEPLITGALLSKDQKVAVIRGKFAPNAINPELPHAVYTQLKQILDEESARSGYTFHIAGGPITDEAFDQVSKSDGAKLMPLLLLAMVAILALLFFSVWAVIIPLVVAVLTIAATLGLHGLLGFKIDAVTAITPQVLLGISVATVMHVLATFFDEKRKGATSKDAAREALADNFVPVVLTNITTALGFASFMVGNIVPVTLFGFLACVGSMFLMVLSLSLVPALLSFYPKKAGRSPLAALDLSSRLGRLGAWVVRHRKPVILSWVALTVLFAAFIPKLTVDSNPSLYFREGHWFRDSINFIQTKGSGGAVYEIVVRGKGPESIKTLDYMRDLDKLSEYLKNDAPVDFANVYSLSIILRNINRSMHADDQAYHTLPDSNEAIAQYLLLYSLSVPVGQDINDRFNVDNSATRVTVIRPLTSTKISRRNIDAISAWAAQNLKHAKLEFTGRDVLYTNMGNNLTDSMVKSLAFDLLVIIPVLLLMFRSVTAGVVSVFSSVAPLVIVLGLMALQGIMLDVGTLMVAALGLGIVVDDTVHLLAHYFKYRKAGEDAETASMSTMRHIGTPALATTLTLICAFAMFTLAQFQPNHYFGLLISIMVALALIADLSLTPALLAWLDGRRAKTPAAKPIREHVAPQVWPEGKVDIPADAIPSPAQ